MYPLDGMAVTNPFPYVVIAAILSVSYPFAILPFPIRQSSNSRKFPRDYAFD